MNHLTNMPMATPRSHLRKLGIIIAACFFMVFGGACVTSAVLKDKNYSYRTYQETVSSFLVSADKKKIVVLGKDRHYLFHFHPKLQRILGSPINTKITADFKTFTLDTSKTTVHGRFQLKLDTRLVSESDKPLLKKLGFIERKSNGETAEWYSHQFLSGQYYRAGNFALPTNSQYLNQTYQVKIREKTPKNDTVRKALLTPLALTADGVLMIGAIPFLIVGSVL